MPMFFGAPGTRFATLSATLSAALVDTDPLAEVALEDLTLVDNSDGVLDSSSLKIGSAYRHVFVQWSIKFSVDVAAYIETSAHAGVSPVAGVSGGRGDFYAKRNYAAGEIVTVSPSFFMVRGTPLLRAVALPTVAYHALVGVPALTFVVADCLVSAWY